MEHERDWVKWSLSRTRYGVESARSRSGRSRELALTSFAQWMSVSTKLLRLLDDFDRHLHVDHRSVLEGDKVAHRSLVEVRVANNVTQASGPAVASPQCGALIDPVLVGILLEP